MVPRCSVQPHDPSGAPIMLNNIIGDMYEAGAAVERWPDVLEQLTRLAGGAGASFLSGGMRPVRWIATAAIDSLIHDYGRQPHANTRISIALPKRLPTFQTDLDLFPREQMEADPFYTEFLRPRGFGWCLGTSIHAPGVDPVIFSVERSYKDGPSSREDVARFNSLRPHMARAMLLSARLNMERARAKADALALVGLPAAVLDGQGRLVALNTLFEPLIPGMAQDRNERLTLSCARADLLLVETLAHLRRAKYAGVQSIPISVSEAQPATVVHLVPVLGSAHDLFSPGHYIIFMTPLVAGPGPEVKLLEALFDLTPAEALIAHGVAEAQSLDALAGSRGVSKETVRIQLRSVFAKTGTRRQAELVRLLSSLPKLTSNLVT